MAGDGVARTASFNVAAVRRQRGLVGSNATLIPETAKQRFSKLFPVLVFLLGCLQYLNTISYDYAWDDKLVITANEYTTQGIRGLPDIFSKRVSVPFKSEYRPVPQALYAIEYQIFRGSPHAGHTFNILWYALTCVMVYVFVRFVFIRVSKWLALLVALLFVVHPLHVEVVANIKSRDEILALFFGLSAILLLVKALEQWRWTLLLGGILCFGTACLCKSNAITLLAMTPVVAWYRSDGLRINRRLATSIGVTAICCLGLVMLIRHVQNTASPGMTLYLDSTVLNNIFLWSAHTETIVPTALVIIARYALLFLYPHPLIHLYGYDQIPLSRWTDYVTWFVIAGLAAVAVIVLTLWRQKLPFVFGVLWFGITYSPYSNLVFYAPDTMADRYMFIPSVGLVILVVYVVYRLASLDLKNPDFHGARTRVVLVLFTFLLAAYFLRTVVGNRDWQNDSTLIHNRIGYMTRNAAAQAIYGDQLNKESYELLSPALSLERKAAAMRAFTRAVQIYPDFQSAWISIGKLFAERGIYDKAELAFLKAQALEPLSADSYLCLGTLYVTEQDSNLAIPYLENAVLLDPKKEEAYVMLGKAYLGTNNIENLGAVAATARKWFPKNPDFKALQATYCFRKKEYGQAFELAREVLAKEPQNTLARAILSSPFIQNLSATPASDPGR